MSTSAERLTLLRQEMERERLDGYLVPRADEFLGEYVPASAKRLEWLTGFTGSSGLAAVLSDRAAVISNSIYTLQMKQQVDDRQYETLDLGEAGLNSWFKRHGIGHVTIGFDPALHSVSEIKRWKKELTDRDITLKPLTHNLVDRIWKERPPRPKTRVEPFLEAFAGTPSMEKRQRVADQLTERGYAAALLADPRDLAWILNIRGRDVPFTPLALSWGMLYRDGSLDWVIDPQRVPPEVLRPIGNAVKVVDPDQAMNIFNTLKARAAGQPVLVDESLTPQRFLLMLEEKDIPFKFDKDPCIEPRACKTKAEQKSIRDAHIKDAVALIQFLSWLDQEEPKAKLDEIGIAEKLHGFRSMDSAFRDSSFDTIAGFAANGAIVHYRATPETNKKLRGDSLLLLDSGAQYPGGTTDITRTIAIGEPSEQMRDHYTAVLRGHIAVARTKFPKGTRGAAIDALARAPLWELGLEYGHGTGHGVGCYLSVHEPGVGLNPRNSDELMPGMVLSNEPGYYREGEYGIRLESLMLVVPSALMGDGRPFYEFETLSLVPFDPNLTRLSVLTEAEREWLAAYHRRIRTDLSQLLPTAEREWLAAVTDYFCE